MLVELVDVRPVGDAEAEMLRPALSDRHARVANPRHRRFEALDQRTAELGIALGEDRLHRLDVRRRPQDPGRERGRAAEAGGLFEHDDAQPALRRRSRSGQPSLPPSRRRVGRSSLSPNNVPAVASLSDISRHAGVSIATCSRVLNGSAHPVSDATRDRVLKAAEELGYAPSALARALVTRSSRIIGRDRRQHRRPVLRRDRARRRGGRRATSAI